MGEIDKIRGKTLNTPKYITNLMSIEKEFKKNWFQHIDCTSDNCIFTFLEKNFDKFECEHGESCYHGKLINKLQRLTHEVECQRNSLIGSRDELRRNSDVILTLITLLKEGK